MEVHSRTAARLSSGVRTRQSLSLPATIVFRQLCLYGLLLMLSGCAGLGAKGPLYGEAPLPSASSTHAIVFVYRHGNFNTDRTGSVHIAVDGKELFRVKDDGYAWFYVRPGIRHFTAEWSMMEKPLFENGAFDKKTLSLAVEAGKTYYINYRILVYPKTDKLADYGVSLGLVGAMAGYKRPENDVQLLEEKKVDALHDLRNCHLQDARHRE